MSQRNLLIFVFEVANVFLSLLCLPQECTSPNEGRQNLHSWSKGQHIPVFLPGKSEGLGSLAGYSPRGHKRVGHGND